VRAIGPEFTQYGVPHTSADPMLEMPDGTGSLIASDNEWQTAIIDGIITRNHFSDIQNSGHAPPAVSDNCKLTAG